MTKELAKSSKNTLKVHDFGDAFDSFKGVLQTVRDNPAAFGIGFTGLFDARAAMAARLYQASVRGSFFQQLEAEVQRLIEDGTIKKPYLKSDQAHACFADLLDAIDKISPDPERFKAIKTAFLRVMSQGETGKNAAHTQEVLRIIYGLSAREIVVLATMYGMGTGGEVTAESWLADVANTSGLMRGEIVEEVEHTLTEKRLIHYRVRGNNGEASHNRYGRIITWGTRNRYTDLGLEVCQHILDKPV